MDTSFDALVSYWILLVGTWIEIFGIFIIVFGIAWSTYFLVHRRGQTPCYDQYRLHIGRSLLLGLELLVAADIVKTIAIKLNFTSLGLLAGLIAVRTFLGWTLLLEFEHRWPWRQRDLAENLRSDSGSHGSQQ